MNIVRHGWMLAAGLVPVLAGLGSATDAATVESVAAEGLAGGAVEAGRLLGEALRRAQTAGGGTVRVLGGLYEIGEGLRLGPDARDIVVEGVGDAVLRLASQARTLTTAPAEAGAAALQVEDGAGFPPGAFVEIRAPGAVDSFSGKQPGFFCAKIEGTSGCELRFGSAIRHPVPAGTSVVRLVNIFQMDRVKRVTIRNLILEGNQQPGDAVPMNHTYHCGVFASGPYTYDRGPTGDPAEDVAIENCTLRGFFHRGIALYSVVRPRVAGCRIDHTGAEAVDFDHFCRDGVAADNRIEGCPIAIELNDASRCLVSDNRISDCEIGINIWRWCRLEGLNRENAIRGNTVRGARKYGIRCAAGADANIIEDNVVEDGPGSGIVLQGDGNASHRNVVRRVGGRAFLIEGRGNTSAGDQPAGTAPAAP